MKYEKFLFSKLKYKEVVSKAKHGFTDNLHLVLSFNFDVGWVVDNQTVYGIQKEYKVFDLDYEKALDYFNTVFAKHNMSNDF